MSKESAISRRKFLKATGIAAGVAALGGSVVSITETEVQAADSNSMMTAGSKSGAGSPRGRMFFTNDLDFSTLSEAAERIFPKDETGPGAKDLSVPFFIDNQLAGAYGFNDREYMEGPFSEGAPTQGYQTPLLRKDLFLQGIAALNRQSEETYKKKYPDLSDSQKDKILQMCEKGEIPTEGFKSSFFFSHLKDAVLAGVYSDPIYSGNAGMSGWKMKQYPGARMFYTDIIESGKFEEIEPISLADMF